MTPTELALLDADTTALSRAERTAIQAREEARYREDALACLLNGKVRGEFVPVYASQPTAIQMPIEIPQIAGILPRLHALLNRITAHESWTPEIGEMLGLIPAEWVFCAGDWSSAANRTDIASENTFAVGRNPREAQ